MNRDDKYTRNGFITYLQTTSIPRGFLLHYPVGNSQKIYRDLYEKEELTVFTEQYCCEIKKSVLINLPVILAAGSFGWQAAAEGSDSNDLLRFSFTTGFYASLALNLTNFLFVPKTVPAMLIVICSKFFPVWLADGLWQPIWQATDNLMLQWIYFAGAGCLYVVTQTGFSYSVKLLLDLCDPTLQQYVPTTNWSIIGTLAWSYWAFGYLMPWLKMPNVLGAFFSVFIGALGRGILVDLPLMKYNTWQLQKKYISFSKENRSLNSEEGLELTPMHAIEYKAIETDEVVEETPTESCCTKINRYLMSRFRCCMSFWQSSDKVNTESYEKFTSLELR